MQRYVTTRKDTSELPSRDITGDIFPVVKRSNRPSRQERKIHIRENLPVQYRLFDTDREALGNYYRLLRPERIISAASISLFKTHFLWVGIVVLLQRIVLVQEEEFSAPKK